MDNLESSVAAAKKARDDKRRADARQKMLDAVEKATRGHVGMYNGFGQYMGACACGLECNAVELIDHIDEIIGAASDA